MLLIRQIYLTFDGVGVDLADIITWLDKNPDKKIIVNKDTTLLEKVNYSFVGD